MCQHKSAADQLWQHPRLILLRKNCDVSGGQAKQRQGDGYVGFAASEGGNEQGLCRKRSTPGGASRSMISPKVTVAFVIANFCGFLQSLVKTKGGRLSRARLPRRASHPAQK
jgi:hypothetical protein